LVKALKRNRKILQQKLCLL